MNEAKRQGGKEAGKQGDTEARRHGNREISNCRILRFERNIPNDSSKLGSFSE
jgi:hypothetical protein